MSLPPAERTWPCGWGGTPCRARLPRRGLCAEHAALIHAIPATPRGSRRSATVKPPATRHPTPQKIDPADVFQSTQARVPAEIRAQHLAAWVNRIGKPVTRADAIRVAGLHPTGGSGRTVLAVAEQRGWVRRGPAGSVLPAEA